MLVEIVNDGVGNKLGSVGLRDEAANPTTPVLRTMQLQHRCFGFSFDDQMRDVLRLLHSLVY